MSMLEAVMGMLGNTQDRYNALEDLAKQPIDRSFVQSGQTPMDVLLRPTTDQNRALLQMGLEMLGSNPAAHPGEGISRGIQSGLGLYDKIKERDREQKMTAGMIGVKGAESAFDQVSRILGIQSRMGPSSPQSYDEWQIARENGYQGDYADWMGKGAPIGPDKDMLAGEKGLRDRFIAVTDEFKSQNDAYGRIIASTKNPSPAGDLSLIFNYMKLLDPGSVVRESEFATAAASGSFGDRIKAMVEQLRSGKRLSDEQRNDFIARAGALYDESMKNFDARKRHFSELASGSGYRPESVAIERALYREGRGTIPDWLANSEYADDAMQGADGNWYVNAVDKDGKPRTYRIEE